MGVPNSEVGYTSAMPRREDHEVHKDMWGIGQNHISYKCRLSFTLCTTTFLAFRSFFLFPPFLGLDPLVSPNYEACLRYWTSKFHDGQCIYRLADEILAYGKWLCRSLWPCGLKRGSVAASLLGLRVRISPGSWMSVFLSVVCFQLGVSVA